MAEKETPKSRRDQFGERLKAKYPDKEYADDEALFGQIDDDYAAYDEEIGKYKEREGKLNALLAMSPSNARFLTDMAKGVDPWIAVIERLGIDGITDLINDPDKQEAYAEANKKYVERLADEERLEEEYRTNLAESLKLLEQLQGEKGLSDETVDAAMDLVLQMANEALVGKFSRETIETALDALNRDADINSARSEGEIAGRNAKIEEKLRKQKSGDGMPTIAGANNSVSREKKAMSIFDYANAAK